MTNMDIDTGKYVSKSARLMDQVREVLRFHHYAYNTEKAYVSWILQYIRFHYKKHPNDFSKQEVELFFGRLLILFRQTKPGPEARLIYGLASDFQELTATAAISLRQLFLRYRLCRLVQLQ